MRAPIGAPPHLMWLSPEEAAAYVVFLEAWHGWPWFIFPAHADKSPACDWPRWATREPSEIEMYWPKTGAAVGVAAKLSNLVFIDHDRDAGPEWIWCADWPWRGTYTRLSINRAGWHEVFRQRSDRDHIGCPKLDFGEVKGSADGEGDGGYVVLSSREDNGQQIIEVPDVVYDLIEERTIGSRSITVRPAVPGAVWRPRVRSTRDVRERLRDLSVFTGTAAQSRGWIDQHVKRWRAREGDNAHHDPMLKYARSCLIEGLAGELDLVEAYDVGLDLWQEVYDEKNDDEYERLWSDDLDKWDAGDRELVEDVEEKRDSGNASVLDYLRDDMRERTSTNGDHPDGESGGGGSETSDEISAAIRGDDPPDLWLPDEFWDKHPRLKAVREAALGKRRSPDSVLDVVLARVGAITSHTVTVPTDAGTPMALGLYVCPISPSGGGKGVAMKVARALVPAPDDVVDPISPGSGEAITDALFGHVEVSTTSPTTGKTETKKIRAQTRHNGIVEYSEGTKLFQQTGRAGTTLTSVIRGAFTNDVIGEDLVDREKTRKLTSGQYVLSVVMGFQPITSGVLFEDEERAAGTPQRFLFSHTQLPYRIESGRREMPPTLWKRVPTPGPAPRFTSSDGETWSWTPLEHECTMAPEATADLLGMVASRAVFGASVDPLDGHETSVLVKVACVLSVFLDESYHVTWARWKMAREIVERSKRVRAWVLAQIASGQAESHRKATALNTLRRVDAELGVEAMRTARYKQALESWVNGAGRTLQQHSASGEHPDGAGCRNACLTGATSGARRKVVVDAMKTPKRALEVVCEELVRRELGVRTGDGRATRWGPGSAAPRDGRTADLGT